MALLDFLKNKEQAEKSKKPAKKAEKVSAVKPEAKKTEVKETPKTSSKTKGQFAFEAIKEPRISEKSTLLSENNQYTFEITAGYNKSEIKKAVEGIYGVDVLSVNVIKIPPKKRRLGRTEGFRKAYQKAVVRIKEGQKIEIL